MNRYITTPIYYASGAPHLGHAYTTWLADAARRVHEMKGDAVLVTSGTDEHGQKIERIAASQNIPPGELVDALSDGFRQLWPDLGISIDRFERTTSVTHQRIATAFWERLKAGGYLYEGTYEGPYCVDCEQYFTAGETCPVHRRPLESFSEPSWFFRLSDFQASLVAHIEANPDFIVPEARRREILAFLRGAPLQDLCVSRTSTRWGVPVPGAPGHVMYVWVDALVSYLSALVTDGDVESGLSAEGIRQWWPSAVHFIGKDILVFHAVYWPALLLAAKLPLPRQLVVNGWLTVEGRKISKSDPDTIVSPRDLAMLAGCDGARYYFLRSVGEGKDLDYARSRLIQVVNSDLANNFGNLVTRLTGLAAKRFPDGWTASGPGDEALCRSIEASLTAGQVALAGYRFAEAGRQFASLSGLLNAWFQQAEPWRIVCDDELATVLTSALWGVLAACQIGYPLVPETIGSVRASLGYTPMPSDGPVAWPQGRLQLQPTGPVFRRIEG